MFWMVLVILFILGAISGSFVVASSWRMRAEQLVAEKDYRDPEYQKLVKLGKLAGTSGRNDRSHCLACGYILPWYDLVPVVSWIFLGGRCRKCRATIGFLEIIAEVWLGILFVLSYLFWPFDLDGLVPMLLFGVWIAWLVVAAVLTIYDLKWMRLPVSVLYLSIGLSFLLAAGRVLTTGLTLDWLINQVMAIVILAGTYWALCHFSDGKWVGSGDAYVGLSLALLVGGWLPALVVLFLANLFGTIIVLPSLIGKKISFSSRIPMGPLLIVAGIIVFWFESNLLNCFTFL